MIVTLDEVKLYLGLEQEDTERDSEISAFIYAAEEYLKNAGIELQEGNELCKLAVKILVTHWFQNREAIGKADELGYSLRHIISQLKFCFPVTL